MAEKIAAMLLAGGIKGEQSCLSRCPLAVWLTLRIDATCSVGSESAWIMNEVGKNDFVDLPAAAIQFVARFDGDHDDEPRTCDWPELVAP
jgi:hypothetical protein